MGKGKRTVTILITSVFIFVCIAGFGVWVWWTNEAYQPTPEKAVEKDAETNFTFEQKQRYTIVEHIDTIYLTKGAIVVYISGTGEFTVVSCKYNDLRDKWISDGAFYLNLETSNELKVSYYMDGTPRYAYEYNHTYHFKLVDDLQAYVNGVKANVKEYTVTKGEKAYEIEFWYYEIASTEEITVEYRNKD